MSSNSVQVAIEGTIEQRKFQSILGNEIFIRKEGESLPRAIAIGALVLPLIPLIAVYDLVRYGMFRWGKCDGQSWSLIHKANTAVAELSKKVEAATAQKVLTKEDLNARSERVIGAHVGKMIEAFRDLGGGFFGKLYNASSVLKAEKEIAGTKDLLVQDIIVYLERNVTKPADFAAHLASVKTYIDRCIAKEAKDDRYAANIVERMGPRPLLSDWVREEFRQHLNGHSWIAHSFLAEVDKNYTADRVAGAQKVKEEQPGSSVNADALFIPEAAQNLIANLKVGVDQEIITSEQAKAKVQGLVRDVYPQVIASSGLTQAAETVNAVLEEGVQRKLMTPNDVAQINGTVHPTPKELATAVVQNIILYKEQNPAAKPAALDQKIASAAQELKAQEKLAVTDEVEFLNEAKDQLSAVQADLDAKAQVVLQAQKEAEAAEMIRIQQEAEEQLEAAQQAEAAQKLAVEKQNLSDALKNFLGTISEKQKTLVAAYGLYEAQAAKQFEIVEMINQILQAKVKVGKTEKTVLEAYLFRMDKVKEISASKLTPAEQRAKLAQFNKDLGPDAMSVISQVHGLEEALDMQREVMSQTIQIIEAYDLEVANDIATYKQLAKGEKKRLDQELKREIEALEKGVLKTEQETTATYRKVHGLSPFADIPSESAKPRDVKWEDFLVKEVPVEEAPSAPPMEKEPEPAPTPSAPSLTSMLWHGITAPLRVVGLVG
ncbi:MAG TPA: hypothetical protein VLF94_07555 [Chlamydiales bacterium]|nr:hypothetical protein [Chlamydiales bacterium]